MVIRFVIWGQMLWLCRVNEAWELSGPDQTGLCLDANPKLVQLHALQQFLCHMKNLHDFVTKVIDHFHSNTA